MILMLLPLLLALIISIPKMYKYTGTIHKIKVEQAEYECLIAVATSVCATIMFLIIR
jgi:hypothetical protein